MCNPYTRHPAGRRVRSNGSIQNSSYNLRKMKVMGSENEIGKGTLMVSENQTVMLNVVMARLDRQGSG